MIVYLLLFICIVGEIYIAIMWSIYTCRYMYFQNSFLNKKIKKITLSEFRYIANSNTVSVINREVWKSVHKKFAKSPAKCVKNEAFKTCKICHKTQLYSYFSTVVSNQNAYFFPGMTPNNSEGVNPVNPILYIYISYKVHFI